MSDSLRPHESQHGRPPCPSPTPGVHSNSCPLSQWCHPAISSSVVPFSSCRELAYCISSAYCILSAALSTASSFRIWNSSTGILSLPGASVRNSAHDKGHEEGGSAYAKAGSSFRSPPGNSRASTPQTWVCLLSALCFHLHLWLYGGCPPPPLSEKRVSLQLQLIIPGCDSV